MTRASSAERHVPIATAMEVVPIAEHDSMQLKLSGADASLRIRNLLILSDSDRNNVIAGATVDSKRPALQRSEP